MNGNKPRILFLPKWYPNKYDPMPGLFIYNHAKALIPTFDIAVIYVHPDDHEDIPKYLVNTTNESGILTIRAYYRNPKTRIPVFSLIKKLIRFRKSYQLSLEILREKKWEPALVHIHVLTRVGVIGKSIAKQKGIPYVISEHWSRYLENNKGYSGIIRKQLTKKVAARAKAIFPVSKTLMKGMIHKGITHKNYQVIPNVVDTNRFQVWKEKKPRDYIRIVHISCFDEEAKNDCGLIDALKILSTRRSDFKCIVIGDGKDYQKVKDYVKTCEMENHIEFTGILTGFELVEAIQESDFFVLSSNYETQAIVLLEALSCGIPVVTTAAGAIPEYLTEKLGFMTPVGNMQALSESMLKMMDHFHLYNKFSLHDFIEKNYSENAIRNTLTEAYNRILCKS